MLELRFHYAEASGDRWWWIDSPDVSDLSASARLLKECLRDALAQLERLGRGGHELIYVFDDSDLHRRSHLPVRPVDAMH